VRKEESLSRTNLVVSALIFVWWRDSVQRPVLKGNAGDVMPVAVSPDGKLLVSAGNDGALILRTVR
jgi:WD40 repeat protein